MEDDLDSEHGECCVKHAKPFINCHTHVFTADHVPPYLAKTFLPGPIYNLLSLRWIVRMFRFWYEKIEPKRNNVKARKRRERRYNFYMSIQRSGILKILVFLTGTALTIASVGILLYYLANGATKDILLMFFETETYDNLVVLLARTIGLQILIVLLCIVFFKSGRNVIWFVLKKISGFFAALPGPKSKALAQRYLNIGRFAFHRTQRSTWEQLQAQYPPGSGFIVLPMDMEYMDAGKLEKGFNYFDQMDDLRIIKGTATEKDYFYPFVFVEPRRIADEKKQVNERQCPLLGKVQLTWTADQNGKVTLGDCFIRDYIEHYGFSGFKIYPALGYYPFDKELLALWKYAADNGIPILTHCIRGTIFFRGDKDPKWDKHEVFCQSDGKQGYDQKLSLLEEKNSDFINNFTHPMNYLCLLDEELLRQVVKGSNDRNIQDMFGYTDKDTKLKFDLRHLKLCFGHFGGDDEWNKFMESDRDQYTRDLIKYPAAGVLFFTDRKGVRKEGKPELLWRNLDWYSTICSMMLQYDNVYSDISYIVHEDKIHPLLKQTLQNPKLRKRTLFGTDFYVVRNHNSERSLLANTIDSLSQSDFNQIACKNPREFLENKIHGKIPI